MGTKSFTKSSYSNSFIICIVAIVILLLTLLMQSCKNSDPAPNPELSLLSVTNASPTLATYNFYLNQSKVNSGALPYAVPVPYFRLSPGEFAAKLTTESSTESLLTKTLKFDNNKIYSLFIVGKATSLDYLLITDDIKVPADEKAFVRFINLSPDAPTLNLAFKDSVTLATDKAYKAASDFVEIPAKIYSFQIKDKASGDVKKELKDIDIKKGKIYTIISKGLLTPSGTEHGFDGQVITNQ
nr:DUF4397 domain-containing protein [Pedobacter panaciterrae]